MRRSEIFSWLDKASSAARASWITLFDVPTTLTIPNLPLLSFQNDERTFNHGQDHCDSRRGSRIDLYLLSH